MRKFTCKTCGHELPGVDMATRILCKRCAASKASMPEPSDAAKAAEAIIGLRPDVALGPIDQTRQRQRVERARGIIQDAIDAAKEEAKKHQRQWRSWEGNCSWCGDDVEVLTTSGRDNYAFDGDEARCVSCRCPGGVSVPADDEAAYIDWHEEPDCQCEWCKTARAREDLAQAQAIINMCRPVLEIVKTYGCECNGGIPTPDGLIHKCVGCLARAAAEAAKEKQ